VLGLQWLKGSTGSEEMYFAPKLQQRV